MVCVVDQKRLVKRLYGSPMMTGMRPTPTPRSTTSPGIESLPRGNRGGGIGHVGRLDIGERDASIVDGGPDSLRRQ
jgi:hypothetical protein